MRYIENKTLHDLTSDQHISLIRLCDEIEKQFQRKVFCVQIRPTEGSPDKIFNILVQFDQYRVNP